MEQNSLKMDSGDSTRVARDAVLHLMDKKDKIEEEIAKNVAVLRSNKDVGMHGPLVDSEGFPRSDIDVYQVRHARHNIICLQNDYTDVMQQIEKGLHTYHAEVRERGPISGLEEECLGGDPFVRINFVAPGSPADIAGLQVEDLLVQFGSVSASNFESLQDIAKIVQHSVNMEISIRVKRKEKFVRLNLVPKTWSGRGLLGCNIVPLETVER